MDWKEQKNSFASCLSLLNLFCSKVLPRRLPKREVAVQHLALKCHVVTISARVSGKRTGSNTIEYPHTVADWIAHHSTTSTRIILLIGNLGQSGVKR